VAQYAGASGRDIKELIKLTHKYCRHRGLQLSPQTFAQCAAFRGRGDTWTPPATP